MTYTEYVYVRGMVAYNYTRHNTLSLLLTPDPRTGKPKYIVMTYMTS